MASSLEVDVTVVFLLLKRCGSKPTLSVLFDQYDLGVGRGTCPCSSNLLLELQKTRNKTLRTFEQQDDMSSILCSNTGVSPCLLQLKQIMITRQLNQRVLTGGWLGGNPRKFHELHESVKWVLCE